jgi:hypothetical protein
MAPCGGGDLKHGLTQIGCLDILCAEEMNLRPADTSNGLTSQVYIGREPARFGLLVGLK